jgi:hypothetical protein
VPDPAPAALLVDATAVDRLDPLGRQMLERHSDRWRAERGPCRLEVSGRVGSPRRGRS